MRQHIHQVVELRTSIFFSSNNTFSILTYPLKNVHGIRHVTWLVSLKFPPWICGWPTNHRTRFRIRISDGLGSRNFMEEILSWQVTWEEWYLKRILGTFYKILVCRPGWCAASNISPWSFLLLGGFFLINPHLLVIIFIFCGKLFFTQNFRIGNF